MALFLDLDTGDAVRVGDHTVVRLEAKSGKRARLRIESTADVEHVKGAEPTTPGLQRTAPPPQAAAAPELPQKSIFTRQKPGG
jgi:hypothetical protein